MPNSTVTTGKTGTLKNGCIDNGKQVCKHSQSAIVFKVTAGSRRHQNGNTTAIIRSQSISVNQSELGQVGNYMQCVIMCAVAVSDIILTTCSCIVLIGAYRLRLISSWQFVCIYKLECSDLQNFTTLFDSAVKASDQNACPEVEGTACSTSVQTLGDCKYLQSISHSKKNQCNHSTTANFS